MRVSWLGFFFASLVGFSGCSSPPGGAKGPSAGWVAGDLAAPSQVSAAEALATAAAYASHPWRPFERNILHGRDRNGVTVQTPDIGYRSPPDRDGWWVPGEVNRGVPYKWGGFDDLPTFDQRIAACHAGGDVSSAAKRAADDAGVSDFAAGVDCSGFVSRCLNLPTVHDTSQLPNVCRVLERAEELMPGDLLNIRKGHVVLVAGWARRDKSWIYYYDTGGGPDYWRPSLKMSPLSPMLALGYQPLRYLGLAFDPTASAKAPLTRTIKTQAQVVPDPVVGEP